MTDELQDEYQIGLKLMADALEQAEIHLRLAADAGHPQASLSIALLFLALGRRQDAANEVASAGDLPRTAVQGVLAIQEGNSAAALDYFSAAADAAQAWERVDANSEYQDEYEDLEVDNARSSPLSIFLSRTTEVNRYPADGSYGSAALSAVTSAGDVAVEMTYFPAASVPPHELCSVLLASSDIYVVIAGYGYGTLVPSRDMPTSYTEFEYDLATARAMRRYVFIVDDEDLKRLTTDDDTGVLQQSKFRSKLLEAGTTVAFVRSPDELSLKLTQVLLSLHEPIVVTPRFEMFVAKDTSSLPGMPDDVAGFKKRGELHAGDFVVGTDAFVTPPTFRAQMNRGSAAFWTLLWTSSRVDALVTPSVDSWLPETIHFTEDRAGSPAGTCGYLSGYITSKPYFVVARSEGLSNVTSVHVEWQYWDAHA